jgi:hypothetical protein
LLSWWSRPRWEGWATCSPGASGGPSRETTRPARANDDPGSIGEAELLRRLEALVDPQRPVRIIGVAIGQDADLQALQRIAEATGGRAHRADTPEDILQVFSSEIAGR